MDRKEKKEKKNLISKHLDTSNSRLKDEEVDFLHDFVNNYDDEYKGKSKTKKSSYDGWSSDGKYTRWEEKTSTFTEDIGIREEYKYHDDDGQSGGNTKEIKDARGIINWFKKQK